MNLQAIDNALSDLLQRRWSWQYEEPGAAAAEQLERQAEQLASQVPDAYAACARSLATGLRDAPAAAMASPRRLAAAPRLPVRNDVGNPAPHVQLVTEHGGLLHGGVITIGNHRVVCRAFCYFRHTNNRTLLGVGNGTSEKVHVVAGVCEQFGPSGRIGEAWSTADDLKEMYRSTSQPLPDGAWRVTGVEAGEGFYVTAVPSDVTKRMVLDAVRRKATPVTLPDDGVPDAQFYGGADEFFKVPPGPAAALENALFNNDALGTDGWVIKTPYLAVFAPDPARVMPDLRDPHVPVIVAMAGAIRKAQWTTDGKRQKTTMTHFTRSAQWRVRTFKLPLPD
jgi:hypothetical protein